MAELWAMPGASQSWERPHGKGIKETEGKSQFSSNFDNERAEELQAGSEKQSIFSKLVY